MMKTHIFLFSFLSIAFFSTNDFLFEKSKHSILFLSVVSFTDLSSPDANHSLTNANDDEENGVSNYALYFGDGDAVGWKFFIVVFILCIVLGVFYLRLGILKRHYVFLEEDVTRQTEGLRTANSILIHKNDEIYKQVGRIIAQQEQILKQNFALEYKAEALRKLSLSKDHLVASLIDDLENPIISLTDIAESLNEALPRLSKSEMTAFIKTIYACSHDIHATLTNVLNWSQLQNKDFEYKPTDFYIGDLVQSNVASLTKQLVEKSFQIDFQIDDTHKVLADNNMINAVLKSLLLNCIKACGDGNLLIKSVETEKHIMVAFVCVCGQETIDQCTDVLSDNSPFSSSRIGGQISALALTIVKEFMRANSGRITIGRGEEGQLILKLQLPKSLKPIERETVKTDHRIVEGLVKFEGTKNIVILIVDNNAEIRNCLKRIFAPMFKVIEASTGSEGLELARKILPAVIIAEVILSDMEGYDFCRTIKATVATRQIPFIFLTNEWSDECKRQGRLVGAADFLVKPISKELLLQSVYRILDEVKKSTILFSNNDLITEQALNAKADNAFFDRILKVVEENLSDPDLDHRKICELMGVSKSVLYVRFKAITGQGVQEFIKCIRLKKSTTLLEEGNLSVNQVALEVGFNSQSYFNKCFLKQYGMGPKEYSRKNKKSTVADVI